MHTLATRRRGTFRTLAILALALTFISLAPADASARVYRGGFGRGFYGRGYGGFYGPRVYSRGYGGFYGPRVYSRGYGGFYGARVYSRGYGGVYRYPYARPYAPSPLLYGSRFFGLYGPY